MTTDEKTNLPDPMKTFQERVLNKVRTDIADMLPEEAIKAMFDKALETVFFKGKEPVVDNWGKVVRKAEPSWFAEEVAKQAEPIVKAYIEKHIEQVRPQIEADIKEFLSAQNLTLLTVAAMQRATMNDMSMIADQIIGRMKQNY